MAPRTQTALLAAVFALAAPALTAVAQTATTETPPAEAATDAANAADTAAETATDAAQDATDAARDAAGAAADAADSAAETTTGNAAPAGDAAATGAENAAPADGAAAADGSAPAAQGATDGDAAATGTAPAATGEPAVGQAYVKETHGDWTVRCMNAPEGQPDPCELFQLLRDSANNPVAEFSILPVQMDQAVAGATIITPLETDLQRGVLLKVDNGEQRAYPFTVCATVGCVSRLGMTDPQLTEMKRGNTAQVTIQPYGAPPDQAVGLSVSLSGFTAGWGALEKIVAEGGTAAPTTPTPAPASQ